MTRICNVCGFQNQDDYDYCAKCGVNLTDGSKRNFYLFEMKESKVNKKAILASYIVTIFLSWSGFVFGLISKNTSLGVFTFFGFFMPFYLVQSPSREIRKHGFIQLLISIIGVFSSFYVIFH